jgi:hypothetical protein
LVHQGATPISQQERGRYYTMIGKWLDQCPLLTPRALADAIRLAQAELLRPARRA